MALRHSKGGDGVTVIRVQCAGAMGGAGVEWVLWWVVWVGLGEIGAGAVRRKSLEARQLVCTLLYDESYDYHPS